MRATLRTLIALVYLASATLAQAGFIINSYTGGGGGGAAAASVTLVGCVNQTGAGPGITLAATNVGTASATRHTILLVMGGDSASAFGVNSVTVGGDAATEIVDQNGTRQVDAAVYILANSAGTSEDIVVTWSEAIQYTIVCVWQANDLLSATAVASVADEDTAAGVLAMNVNTTTDGIAVGGCLTYHDAQTTTWVGLTERVDAADALGVYSAADLQVTGGATPLTVSCDWTGTNDAAGAVASFR